MKTKRSLFYAALFGVIALLTFSCKKEEKPEVSLTLSRNAATLTVGASEEITATVVNSTETVAWTSSNPAVATVGAMGNVAKVTAVAAGSADIKATVAGKEAVCKVTVISNEFQLQPNALNLNTGDVAQVKAFNAEGEIQWSTEPADIAGIANVTFEGTTADVAALGEGSFKIVAKSGNAVAMCDVTVSAQTVEHPTVAPTAGMITLAFKAPAFECDNVQLDLVGDFQGWKEAEGTAATPLDDPNYPNWYKVVFSAANDGETAQGKLISHMADVTGSWLNEQDVVEILEGPAHLDGNIMFDEGSKGGVVYMTATFKGNPCDAVNDPGDATFSVSISEIPESVDKTQIHLYVRGMGQGLGWTTLGELAYDEDFGLWGGTISVPGGCAYKYCVTYKATETEVEAIYEVYGGDGSLNRTMPLNLTPNDEITAWQEGKDPWVEPEPTNPEGNATFTIDLGLEGYNVTAAKVVGNFGEESEYGNWSPAQGLILQKNELNLWVGEGSVPANFVFKVLASIDGSEITWDGPGLDDPNRKMALDLKYEATYTLEDWKNLPEAE